jgi:diguanylate cyclase (GGDEF)-like protein
MIVPLSAEGRTLGVLIAEQTATGGARVERRVVAMLERFASHAALALRNAWLLEQVRSMAATDGLTGISNRRSFDTALEREVSRAGRNGEQMSLLLLDLDHFKLLNDNHGHQMGDDVLRSVAQSLVHQCRDFDTAARYGGEEFAVIMPGCSQADAMSAGERYREAIEHDVGPVTVTASVGVACLPTHAATAAALLKRADEALYESKRGGRNRVTVASTENVVTST